MGTNLMKNVIDKLESDQNSLRKNPYSPADSEKWQKTLYFENSLYNSWGRAITIDPYKRNQENIVNAL